MRKLTKLSLLALFAMLTFSISSCHKDMENDIKDLQEKQSTLATVADMTAKIEAVNKQKEELEKKVDSQKAELQKSVTDANTKITALETKHAALEAGGATKAELKKVADDLAAEVSARALLAAKVDGFDETVNKAIADLDAAQAAIIANKAELEAALASNHEEALAKIAETDARLTAEILRIDGAISTLNTELTEKINTVAEDLETLKSDFIAEQTRVSGELGRLEQEDINIKAALESLKGEVADKFTSVEGEITSVITALSDLEERLNNVSGDREAILQEVGTLMDALEQRIETKINNVIGRVEALERRIQSINFISDYSDGKATANILVNGGGSGVAYGDLTLRFRVYPAAKAADLVADYAAGNATLSLSLNSVKTTRATTASIAIKSVTQDVNGDVIVVATPSNWSITDKNTYSMSLDVVYGIDNTSSNVFAVAPAKFGDSNLDFTGKDTQIGDAAIINYEMPYNNADVVSIDNEFFLGAFEAGELESKVADLGFDMSTVSFGITHAASTVTSGGGSDFGKTAIASALADAQTNNFVIDVAARTVRLDDTGVTTFIGNTLTLTVVAKVGNDQIAETDLTFTIIAKPTFKANIDAFDVIWAQDFDNAVHELDFSAYDAEVKAALSDGLTIIFENAHANAPFDITWNNGESKLVVTPNQYTTWVDNASTEGVVENLYSKVVVKAQNPTSKRNIEITLLAVNAKLPVAAYSKVSIFWKGNSMVVRGKFTGDGTSGNPITDFVMEGNATQGFTADGNNPEGVTLEVVQHTAVDNITYIASVVTYAKNEYFVTEAAKTAIAKAELVFTSTTGAVPVVRIPLTGFEKFNIIPSDVIKDVKNSLAPNAYIEMSSTVNKVSLDNYLRFKDISTDSDLRKANGSDLTAVSATQDAYYVAVDKYETDKAWELYGLSNASGGLLFGGVTYDAKTFGAFYTIGEIKYADPADGQIDQSSIDKVKTSLAIGTKATNGQLEVDFNNMQLQKDVIVTINVTVNTFWNQYTTTIPVKLTK